MTPGLDALVRRPEQESTWRRFWSAPIRFSAVKLYYIFSPDPQEDPEASICVVCISDTHDTQPALPDGDILFHAGDLTQSRSLEELNAQIEWLDKQPHGYKVVIAGNHELCLDHDYYHRNPKADTRTAESRSSVNWRSLIYLQNSSATLYIGGRPIKIYGSPHTPKHGNWAFEYPRGGPHPWEDSIPVDTDILITHGPPKTHLDLGRTGCQFLLRKLWSLKRKPILHVCGHIHGGYGRETLLWDPCQAAYERTTNDNGGIVNLILLLSLGLCRVVSQYLGSSDTPRTTLVNAASIRGVKDEKRRGAITVHI